MTQKGMFSPIRVSVVGTAGRKADGKRMNSAIFRRMIDKTIDVITNDFKLKMERVHLISGGAAWSDHVAVVLYLLEKVPLLTLHFPTTWEEDPQPHFYEAGGADWKKNPGKAANDYHKKFSEAIKEDSLQQIQIALYTGAKYRVHDGFKQRNCSVAESEYLIAFTWGEGEEPKIGGTHDTWTKCMNRKIHIPLRSLSMDHHEESAAYCSKRPTEKSGEIATRSEVSEPPEKKQREQSSANMKRS